MIRGGVFSVYEKRHLKCNNRYLDNYDPTQDETYGLLVDANNLYGGITEKFPLPLNSFVTVNTDLQHILNTSNDSSTGYILEVDLGYPTNLHDSHRDFPLAPTKEVISYHELSSWQQDILRKIYHYTPAAQQRIWSRHCLTRQTIQCTISRSSCMSVSDCKSQKITEYYSFVKRAG